MLVSLQLLAINDIGFVLTRVPMLLMIVAPEAMTWTIVSMRHPKCDLFC